MSCYIETYDSFNFCHEDNEKKSCFQCGSLQTKKKGFTSSILKTERGPVKRKLQRYYCHSCGISFTSKGYRVRARHSFIQQQKAVLDFVFTKSSLREVSYRYDVSHQTILNWMMKLGDAMETQQIPPRASWSGYICFDGKETKVKGQKRILLFSSDAYNGYPFQYFIALKEDTLATEVFLKRIQKEYPVSIKGITSDFGRGKCFIKPVQTFFPEVPHQICLVHYLRYVWLFIPRTRRSVFFWRNKVLKDIIKRTVQAPNRASSLHWLGVLQHFEPFFRASYHKRFLRSINRNYDLLTAYYDQADLPKTTNISENFNRQLERKLKNLDGFKSDKSLHIFIKLWLACYRLNHMNINRKVWRKYLWNCS